MKINRLLEITIILLNKGTITAKELAGRFGVSARTIYRDIDVLSSAGVPVFTNKGNGGGISLLESFSISKALISERESESLLLALKTLQAAKYPEIDAVLDKIGAVFKNAESAEWVYIDFSPWASKPNEYNKFNDIRKAILKRMVISFEYINADGGKSSRSIEPMKLIFKGQAWYLWGYCRIRQDYRTFRITRIKNLSLTGKFFERRNPENLQNDDAPQTPKKLTTVRLKFQPEVLHRLYDDFDDELIIRNEDGTCCVTVTFPEDEWIYGYILSFGPYAEVLEPAHIREIISGRMKKALEYYRK